MTTINRLRKDKNILIDKLNECREELENCIELKDDLELEKLGFLQISNVVDNLIENIKNKNLASNMLVTFNQIKINKNVVGKLSSLSNNNFVNTFNNPLFNFVLGNKERIQNDIVEFGKNLKITEKSSEAFLRHYISQNRIIKIEGNKNRLDIDNARRNHKGIAKLGFGATDELNHVIDKVSKDFTYYNFLRPYSDRAYEDVSYFYGNNDSEDHLELLIDVKWSEKKGSGLGSGNMLSYEVANQNFDRLLFYFILKHKSNKLIECKIIAIQELDFSVMKIEKTSQYLLSQVRKENHKPTAKFLLEEIRKVIELKEIKKRFGNTLSYYKKNNKLLELAIALNIDIPEGKKKSYYPVNDIRGLIPANKHKVNLLNSFNSSSDILLTSQIENFEKFIEELDNLT